MKDKQEQDRRLSRKTTDSFMLSTSLDAVLEKHHITLDNPYIALCRQWDSLLEVKAQGKSRVIDLKGTVLVIEVKHPAWGSVIEMRKNQIISDIRGKYPGLNIKNFKIVMK